MQERHPDEKRLTKQQVLSLVQQFERTGSVVDGQHTNDGRPKSVRSSESKEKVRQVILETPQRSIRKIMGDITNNPSRASVRRMLQFDLKLIPYTISVMKNLKESDITSTLGFARRMKEHIEILDSLTKLIFI